MRYQSSVVYEFTCPGCNSRYIGKTDRCRYTRLKKHSQDNKSEIFNHIMNCEHFQHIKSMLELNPHYENNSSVTCILPEFILNNSKIIEKSADYWSFLLFKESLTLRRFKPQLNHGTKAYNILLVNVHLRMFPNISVCNFILCIQLRYNLHYIIITVMSLASFLMMTKI